MSLAISGRVASVSVTKNGKALRVIVESGRRVNDLVMFPAGAAVKPGDELKSVEVHCSVERSRDGNPTPYVVYWAERTA